MVKACMYNCSRTCMHIHMKSIGRSFLASASCPEARQRARKALLSNCQTVKVYSEQISHPTHPKSADEVISSPKSESDASQLSDSEIQPCFPKALFLHGLGGHCRNLRALERKLIPGKLSVFIDQRNHGRSPHTETMTLADLAADIQEIVSTDDSKVALIAHSLGGRAAMVFALLFPELVSALAILDVCPGNRSMKQLSTRTAGADDSIRAFGWIQKCLDVMCGLNLAQYGSRDILKQALSEEYGAGPEGSLILSQVLSNIKVNAEGSLEWTSNVALMRKVLFDGSLRWPEEELDSLTYTAGPVVFVRGEQSCWVSEEDRPEILKYFPNAVLVAAPGSRLRKCSECEIRPLFAAHLLHHEYPKEVAAIIRNEWEQLTAGNKN